MVEHVEIGRRRARYAGTWLGPMSDAAQRRADELAESLREMEALGLSPLLDDGAIAGNGALAIEGGGWLVSASGRRPGEAVGIEVVSFDRAAFAIAYRGERGREPTSDVALHLAALTVGAKATLHGHALERVEDASRLGLPIGDAETEFGTREDLEAMEALIARAPYPAHRVWIRRGHGFLVAAETMAEARSLVRALAAKR